MNSENDRRTADSSRLPPAKLVRRKQPWLVQELTQLDGIDPRPEARKEERLDRRGKPDHSSERLARQMFDALSVAITLPSWPDVGGFAIGLVRQKGPNNRYEAITRKRVPDLVFQVLPAGVTP